MSVELDLSQRFVVDAEADQRLLVIAGAGRGKTEVVAARIDTLVTRDGLYPADEILVLTFSRAAVAAARRRLETTGTDSVSVSTFDSFASRLLIEAGQDPLDYGSFDGRIRAATAELACADLPGLDVLRHVLLDEVQDLVGDRADFACALLSRLDRGCGFTALGDPLQAIYDWQLQKSDTSTTSVQLTNRLVDEFGAERTTLANDYRARGKDPIAVVELGNTLRGCDSVAAATSQISEFIAGLLSLGDIADATNLVQKAAARTAVLCRTNGDALAVSSALREDHIPHMLRRPIEEVGAAPWIARVFAGIDRETISESDVRAQLETAMPPLTDDEAWESLKIAEGDLRNRGFLRMSRLRSSMRSRAFPLNLAARDEATIIVSTIHRAKGLEFDRVIMVEPLYQRSEEDPWARIRTEYVGLSRARDELLRCDPPKSARSMSRNPYSHRWTRVTFKNKRQWPWAMEVLSRDVDVTRPVRENTDGSSTCQQVLSDPSTVGAQLDAALEADSPAECPRYALQLTANHGVVGRTSESFGTDLIKTFGRRNPGQAWPKHIDGIAIAAIESVAGEPDYTRAAGLPGSGIWLIPRLTGLARPQWNDE